MKRLTFVAAFLVASLALLTNFAGAAQNAVTPSTNDINTANGWAHVVQLSHGVGTTDLQFVSTRGFYSCFEYRTDGDTSQVLTENGGVNYNSGVTDGLYPYVCEKNSSETLTIHANAYVEVRMVFGAETDERFDWTRFNVDPTKANLSLQFSASGTADITSGSYLGFVPATVGNGATTTFTMSTHQPVNVCRTTGTCPAGYPNWGAYLTITGLEAAGLTFTGNGDTSAGCTQVDPDTVKCNYPFFNNYDKSDHFNFTEGSANGNFTVNVDVQVYDKTPPTNKDQCKDGGWAAFKTLSFTPITGGYFPVFTQMFKNQGDCVSYVATGGTNPPSGN